MRIRIRYNGTRFPRTIALSNHETKSFQKDRTEIELDENDVYILFKNNARIGRDTWEFNVVGIVAQDAPPIKKEVERIIPKEIKPAKKKERK